MAGRVVAAVAFNAIDEPDCAEAAKLSEPEADGTEPSNGIPFSSL